MIITCEKCSTSFNLDDSIVKESGTKVRCSVCKLIFTAYPEAIAQAPADDDVITMDIETDQPVDQDETTGTDFFDEEPPGLELEDDSQDELFDTGLSFDDEPSLEMEDSPLSLESDDLTVEAEPALEEDPGFDFDEDLTVEDNGLEIEDDTFEVTEASLEPEGLSLEMESDDKGTADFEADDDFSFQADNFETKADEEDAGLELELEESDQDMGLEIAEEGLESDDSDSDDIDSDDSEFAIEQDLELEEPVDDIEFEPLIEDDDADEAVDFDEAESSLTPEVDEEIEEEEFELEFDYEDDEDDQEVAEPQLEEEPPIITPEEDFSEYDDVLEQETEPEEPDDEEVIEIDDSEEASEKTLSDETEVPEKPARTHRRKTQKRPLIGTPVLILFLLFILVLGAYIASYITGYKIKYLSDVEIPYVKEYIDKYIPKKTPPVSDVKPILNQKSVNGRFVSNTNAGNLFVITGRVENQSNLTFGFVQIKGSLSTKQAMEAKTKTVYAGNLITEEMLKTGKIQEIEKLLMVKEGRHNSNVKIRPGATVPFMLVFYDYPEEQLQNFVVRIQHFEQVSN